MPCLRQLLMSLSGLMFLQHHPQDATRRRGTVPGPNDPVPGRRLLSSLQRYRQCGGEPEDLRSSDGYRGGWSSDLHSD